ncbi:MAG: WecB/TagA/CpsF family glycosyltransferase [Oscillospiraceae bacterium]|jgi:N-acetylglucosaminyldiphosphoundecaprenol N-acetyl-beta-D-mannosaminyltransferase|nr:WecB/TagA/CpsF family glycosyltransferase [Oscillospiraceae bacterium]
MRINVLGVSFNNLTMDEAVSRALTLINERGGAYVVTPNPEIVMLARKDHDLQDALAGAALTLPDGVGIVLASKLLGTPLRRKLPGIDFACALMDKLSERGASVFLLGASNGENGEESVAQKAAAKLKERFPGLIIVGAQHGYFSEDEPIIEQINASRPDLLLVCLGSPKQEQWMARNAKNLNVGLMAGLGGALDVFSGEVNRAPERWQHLGLEWLYRLLHDPARIKRMGALPRFGFAVLGARLKKSGAKQ